MADGAPDPGEAVAQAVLRGQLVTALTRMAVMLASMDPARNRSFEAGEDGLGVVELAIRGLCAAVGMQELVLTATDVVCVERFTARRAAHERATEASVH